MIPKSILDDICGHVPNRNDWTMTKAQEWFDLLKKNNIKGLRGPAWLYKEVHDHYNAYQPETEWKRTVFGALSIQPIIKQAEQKLCQNKYHEVVHLAREQIHHELESLDSYYCPTCNAFWREP